MSDLVNGGYVLKTKTVRIPCELVSKGTTEPAYPGLWAEVRKNLTVGELRDLHEAARELDRRADANRERTMAQAAAIDQRRAALAADDADDRAALAREQTAMLQAYADENDQILIDRFSLIAPHVHAWNLYTVDDAGEFVPIPPPREAGVAVINEIDIDLVIWLVQQTLTAYRLGFVPGSPRSGASAEPTPAPNGTASTAKSMPGSRRSPKRSPSPAA